MSQNWQRQLIEILIKAYPNENRPKPEEMKSKIIKIIKSLHRVIQLIAQQISKNPQEKFNHKLMLLQQIGKNKSVKDKYSRAWHRCWITTTIEKAYVIASHDSIIQMKAKDTYENIQQGYDCLQSLLTQIEDYLSKNGKMSNVKKVDKLKLLKTIKTSSVYIEYQTINKLKKQQSKSKHKKSFIQEMNEEQNQQQMKKSKQLKIKMKKLQFSSSFQNREKSQQKNLKNANQQDETFSQMSYISKQASQGYEKKKSQSFSQFSQNQSHQSQQKSTFSNQDSFEVDFMNQPTDNQYLNKLDFKKKKLKKVAVNAKQAYKQMLKDIEKIIEETDDPTSIQEQILNYLNNQCSHGQFLQARNQMKKTLHQLLRIKVGSTLCDIVQADINILRELQQQFKNFALVQRLLQMKKSKQITSLQFVESAQNTIYSYPHSCYWITFAGQIFILEFIKICCSASKTNKLFKMLRDQNLKIDLAHKIAQYGSLAENTLFDHILMKSQLNNKNVYIQLAQKAVEQGINLEQQCIGSDENYVTLLQRKGLQKEQIMRIVQEKGQFKKKPKFRKYLFDFMSSKTKQIRPLIISVDKEGQLYALISCHEQYQNYKLSDMENTLIVNLTRFKMTCQWKNQDFQDTGVIICKNQIPKTNIAWVILQPNLWISHLINQDESEQITKKIRLAKNSQQPQKIRLQLKSFKANVSINPVSFLVNKVTQYQESSIWEQVGIIFWVPSFKQKTKSSNSQSIQKNKILDVDSQEQGNNLRISENNNQFNHNIEPQDDYQEQQIKKQLPVANVLQKKFKGLQYFLNQFQFPSDNAYHIQQRDIVTADYFNIKYLQRFEHIGMYQQLNKSLYCPRDQKANRIQKILPLQLLQPMQRKLKLTNVKLDKKISSFKIFQNSNSFIIKAEINSNTRFVSTYLSYLQYLIEKEKKKIVVPIQMTPQKSKIIQAMIQHDKQFEIDQDDTPYNQENMGMKSKSNNKIEKLITLPPSKMKDLINMDQQTMEYKMVGLQILARMLKNKPNLEKDLNIVKQNQENIFKLKGSSKKIAQFSNEFTQLAVKMQVQKQNEMVTKFQTGKSSQYQIYKNASNQVPNFQVSKFCDDLMLIYKKRDQQIVYQTIEKARKKWEDQQTQFIKNNKLQFILKNVDHSIVVIIYQKLNSYYQQMSKNLKLPMHVQHKKLKKNQFMIALKNCADPNCQFQSQVMNASKRAQELNKIKKNLFNYQYIILKYLQPFTKCKVQDHQKKYISELRAKYKKDLTSILEQISKEKDQALQQNFCQFLKKDKSCKFSQKYTFNPHEEIQNELKNKISKMNMFEKYLKQYLKNQTEACLKISEIVMDAKVKNEYSQNILNRHIDKFRILDIEFQDSKFNPKMFYESIRCLSIDIKTHFKIELPMIQHLQDFKKMLNDNNILIVKTGTGSGKSTVLPPFMSALGYKKILVTQPRRLACKQIYKRVKSIYGPNTVGYKYAGQSKDEDSQLLYQTDGLFKQSLYGNRPDKTLQQSAYAALQGIQVIMLDQIHERTKNIDAIILFLSKWLSQKSSQKIILCSATVDDSIGQYFDKNMKIGIFEVQVQRHKVTQFPIQNMSILDKATQLSGLLKKDEQMLIFFPSVDEAVKAKQFFVQKKQRLAYCLHGAQSSKEQDQALLYGQIFCSTSIAETSLTFQKLKYVLDSRKSRIMTFNPKYELYCTQQIYSSNSSGQQRKGRLGRNCEGQYYFLAYKDFNQKRKPYDLTQIQKLDLTNVIFQFMLKYKEYDVAVSQLSRLNLHKNKQFIEKEEYAKKKFKQFVVVTNNNKLNKQLELYGNLGCYSHNIALDLAKNQGCLHNMIAIISFFMFGRSIFTQLINTIPINKRYQSGDIQTVANYLMQLSKKIDLINNFNMTSAQIKEELIKAQGILKGKKWLATLIKILNQMKKLYIKSPISPSISETKDWSTVLKILVSNSYQHYIYISSHLFGRSKRYYEKLIEDQVFKIGNRIQSSQIHYFLEKSSLVAPDSKKAPPDFIFSMFANVSPVYECVLTFNSIIPYNLIEKNIDIEAELQKAQIMAGALHEDQRDFFEKKKNQLKAFFFCDFQNDKFKMKGKGKLIRDGLKKINQQRRKTYLIDLNQTLQDYIKVRKDKQNNKKNLRRIDENLLKDIFKTLNFFEIFSTLKYDLENNYSCQLKWKGQKIELSNANVSIFNRFVSKIKGFFTWYIECQNIMTQNFKVPVRQPQYKKMKMKKPQLQKILDRVNQIVDPEIDWQTLRYMASVQKPGRSLRVSRMIVVCWVLTNQFGCSVKGGFIRDWVIRADQYIPNGADLKKLLTRYPGDKVPRLDDMITPSDIDAQMSNEIVFDQQKFKKLMDKVRISCQIVDDGWRKILIFDEHQPSGGFTADLIEPYTAICYDTYDFDVNIFYLKQGHLNQIGIKIPLKLSKIQANNRQQKEISLQELINDTLNKKMRIIKAGIPNFRLQKFKDRKWNIDQAVYQSVVYQSNKTTSYIDSLERFQKINPGFSNTLGKNILRVEHLVNHSWDSAYKAAKQWILRQHNTTNQKILYHGTSQIGMKGIKQNGFDSRYYNPTGYYGRGAYFADDPLKSDGYTGNNPNGQKYMFICQVALGKQQVLKVADNNKLGPSKGYHSILGLAGKHNQYIIQRWGQAVPIYLITYK